MAFKYKLSNFIAIPTDDDTKIRLYNKHEKLIDILDPDIIYYYWKDNTVVIKVNVDNKDDIVLDFETSEIAMEAFKKLNFVKEIFKNRPSKSDWYTQAQLQGGVLNTIYYTQTEIDNFFTTLTLSGLSDVRIIAPVCGQTLVYLDGYWYNMDSPAVAGLIGPDEAGNSAYTEGVFTDFTELMRVGIPIDRFNRLFLALIPPSAPALYSWDSNTIGDENCKLSFDNTHNITSYFNANDPGDTGNPNIALNGSWTITSPLRLGVVTSAFNNISGDLNYNVAVGSGSPNPAYSAKTFSDANKGFLYLYVNDVLTSSLDLTSTTSAITNTSYDNISGFNVSAQHFSLFPNGTSFEYFINRAGNWLVKNTDANIRLGYNYVTAKHSFGTTVRTLSRVEFIVDNDATATVFSSITFDNLVMTGGKKLSGIEYYTAGAADYKIIIDNAYRNTYSPDSDAIKFHGTGVVTQQHSAPIIVTDYTTQLNYTGGSKKVMIINDNLLLDDYINCQCTVKRPLSRTSASSLSTINNILLDANGNTSTNTLETFYSETYRLASNSSYNNPTEISSGVWDSYQSLYDGVVGHTDGMQVIGGYLIYPGNNVAFPNDFRTSNIPNGPTFNNGIIGGSARDYSSLSGVRKYIRYFYSNPSTNYKKFRFNISGNLSSGSLIQVSGNSLLSTNDVTVEIKSPGINGAWLDACKPFITNKYENYDGCLYTNTYPGCAFNANWEVTWGTKGTYDTSGYVVMRISFGDLFIGNIYNINFEFI